jgi:CBS domain containing-hemolysin-like protein
LVCWSVEKRLTSTAGPIPISPPSGPTQWLFQGPPAESKLLAAKQREDGSWLIDGLFEIEKLPERLEGFVMPEGGGDEFQTVSGWLMSELGRVPKETDRITAGDWTFEVIDMDSTRVDKVLAMRNPQLLSAE